MQAIEILMGEHQHILRVLDATEQAVRRARAEQTADPAYFLELSRFVELFAEGAHHVKEEGVLFRALQDFGLPAEGGPLHCMLAEHVMGRGLKQQLEVSARALHGGDASALFDVLDAASRYAELLRSHIRKEDLVLYPMAEQLLPPEVLATLVGRYAEVTTLGADDFARAANLLTGWSSRPATAGTPALQASPA